MLMDRVGYDVGAAGEGLLELRVNRRGFRPGKIRFEAAVRAKLGAQRELAPDNRRQLFVLDVDQLDRVLGQVATLGHDDRHRIADEAHVALREGGDGREREILGRPSQSRPTASPFSSGPVQTATTPGSALAGSASIEAIRAWASGLRANAACSIPGRRTSSM